MVRPDMAAATKGDEQNGERAEVSMGKPAARQVQPLLLANSATTGRTPLRTWTLLTGGAGVEARRRQVGKLWHCGCRHARCRCPGHGKGRSRTAGGRGPGPSRRRGVCRRHGSRVFCSWGSHGRSGGRSGVSLSLCGGERGLCVGQRLCLRLNLGLSSRPRLRLCPRPRLLLGLLLLLLQKLLLLLLLLLQELLVLLLLLRRHAGGQAHRSHSGCRRRHRRVQRDIAEPLHGACRKGGCVRHGQLHRTGGWHVLLARDTCLHWNAVKITVADPAAQAAGGVEGDPVAKRGQGNNRATQRESGAAMQTGQDGQRARRRGRVGWGQGPSRQRTCPRLPTQSWGRW